MYKKAQKEFTSQHKGFTNQAMRVYLLSLLSVILLSASAQAQDWLHWHSSNLQLLHGSGFELSENVQTTLKLEHVHGWR